MTVEITMRDHSDDIMFVVTKSDFAIALGILISALLLSLFGDGIEEFPERAFFSGVGLASLFSARHIYREHKRPKRALTRASAE